MFELPPMPTRKQLSAMSDQEIESSLKSARAALQEAKQLAKNSSRQEKVFDALEKEQKRRSKSALQVELEESKKDEV